MGSLSRQRARNELFDSINNRLEQADTQEERESVYNECIDSLARIAIDCGELTRVSNEIAPNDESDDQNPDHHLTAQH